MHEQIKTEAGKELFKYFNDNYGSIIWGPVLEGILAIEKEMENDISQAFIGKCQSKESDQYGRARN